MSPARKRADKPASALTAPDLDEARAQLDRAIARTPAAPAKRPKAKPATSPGIDLTAPIVPYVIRADQSVLAVAQRAGTYLYGYGSPKAAEKARDQYRALGCPAEIVENVDGYAATTAAK